MSYVLGFSGGSDSVCAWHKTKHLNPLVVYVNHNVNDLDKQEEQWCLYWAEKNNVNLIVHQLSLESGNFENIARKARYEALSQYGNKIIVGHHADDNVEGFFLKLFRGAGLRGLVGLKAETNFDNYTVIRPLLNMYKKDILDYCLQNSLNWIDDPTNFYVDRNRVFFRNSVIPEIETHYPNMKNNVLHSMNVISEQLELLNEIALEDWNYFCIDNNIDISKMCELSFSRQKNAFMAFVYRNYIQNVKYRSIESYLKQLNRKNNEAKVSFTIGNFKFKQNKNKLEIYYE